jgi:hypothetical protein
MNSVIGPFDISEGGEVMVESRGSRARSGRKEIKSLSVGELASPRVATSMDHHIGRRLREAREARKLSLIQLSELAQIAPQQLQKYEAARTRVSASRLYQLAVLLDRPVLWFFED